MTDKPKRGRRTKQEMNLINSVQEYPIVPVEAPIQEQQEADQDQTQEKEIPVAKKRGRKPKGGKIIQQNILNNSHKEFKENIILHLKCSLKDIESDCCSKNIDSFLSKTELSYQIINPVISTNQHKVCPFNEYTTSQIYSPANLSAANLSSSSSSSLVESSNSDLKDKEIWRKLKILEHNLHINNLSDKKSACFWCSYDFDSNPIYIPKHVIKESYNVYGCFCSPECATAYLMEENLDSSTKFERYYLLNHLYTKIYNYTKNIKPAPNPHYMLDKFYGNLTIQQYRALLKSERLFLIVDKPLTRILPEFHEDNDEFIINNKIIPINNNVKKVKPQTKNNIVSEHFGLNA